MTRLVCFRLDIQDMSLQFVVIIDTSLRLEECSFFGGRIVEAGVRCQDRCGMNFYVPQQ